MNNNKNVILAIGLAAAVLLLWQYFVAAPAMRVEQARQQQLARQQRLASQTAPQRNPQTNPENAPALPGISTGTAHMSREAALKAGGARVAIDAPMVDGSILLKGARFDDLRLRNYRQTIDPKSP